VHHFRYAGEDHLADELAERVTGTLYGYSLYKEVMEIVAPVLQREKSLVPWWAWIRAGMCALVFGRGDDGLAFFLNALEKVENKSSPGSKMDYGTTLNNISQIYYAKGEYDRALEYLEQSLAISQEIGDRAGMILTLHNMAHISLTNNDPQKAVEKFRQALEIAVEIRDARGIFHVSSSLVQVLAGAGLKEQALGYLRQAAAVGEQCGFPGIEQLQAFIARLEE
jgi:tetratricopeptide (TPR) repeat protein